MIISWSCGGFVVTPYVLILDIGISGAALLRIP